MQIIILFVSSDRLFLDQLKIRISEKIMDDFKDDIFDYIKVGEEVVLDLNTVEKHGIQPIKSISDGSQSNTGFIASCTATKEPEVQRILAFSPYDSAGSERFSAPDGFSDRIQ